MSDTFTASTQYGDLTGTVSFDGYDGDFLNQIAAKSDVPEDQFPIGFGINSLWSDENGTVRMSIDVIAVPCKTVGESVVAMLAYEREHGELPAKRYDCSLTFAELLPLMNRMNICARAKELESANVQIQTS